MLVSFATGIVASQALPGIKLRTEVTQTHQRQARNLCYRHLGRSILRHPDRQLRQRAVRLADNQSDFITTPIVPGSNDYRATTRMKAVPDRRLTRLIVSIMSLVHPLLEWSSAGSKPRTP
jgi:hypothetical protein